MSRFLCVGSCAFRIVALFGPTFFDVVRLELVFFSVVFVFISTPRRSAVLKRAREKRRRSDTPEVSLVQGEVPSGPP